MKARIIQASANGALGIALSIAGLYSYVSGRWLALLGLLAIVVLASRTLFGVIFLVRQGIRTNATWTGILIELSFWTLAAISIQWSLCSFQFAPDRLKILNGLFYGLFGLAAVSVFLPTSRFFKGGYRAGLIVLSIFIGSQLYGAAKGNQSAPVDLSPPFTGEWAVIQGGGSILINHHFGLRTQRDALDLVKLVNGREKRDGQSGFDAYSSWGAEILAPADGEVVLCNDLYPDNLIGATDRKHLTGNTVVLKIAPDLFVLLAHLQHGSIHVKLGDHVVTGQAIAKCGNSGNTSSPHLHMQVQTRMELRAEGQATRAIRLRGATVLRGNQELPVAIPQRNDHIIIQGKSNGPSL